MHQTKVDHDAAAVTRFVQRFVQPPQIRHSPQHAHVAGQCFDLVQHLHAAEQLRHRAERLCRRAVAIGRERVAQRSERLVFDQAADALRSRTVHAQLFDQRLIDLCVANLNAEIIRSRRIQCAERGGQDIFIGFQPVRTDQLRADLQKLAFVPVVARYRAEHLLAVIQPHGQCCVVQAGRRDAGDRGGVIRPRHADAPRPVDNLQHVLLIELRVRLRKHIIILDRRGDDLAIAAALKRIAHGALSLPQRTAGGEQQVAGPLGGGNTETVHGRLTPLSLYRVKIIPCSSQVCQDPILRMVMLR